MVLCAAFNCNVRSDSGEHVPMYTFPKDDNLTKTWVKNLRTSEDYWPSKHSKLCIRHFEPDQFEMDPELAKQAGYKKIGLKQGAIPTIFDFSLKRKCSEVTVGNKRPKSKNRSKAQIKRQALQTLNEMNHGHDDETTEIGNQCADLPVVEELPMSSVISVNTVHTFTQTPKNLVSRRHVSIQTNIDVGVCTRDIQTQTDIMEMPTEDIDMEESLYSVTEDDPSDQDWTPDIFNESDVIDGNSAKERKFIVFESNLDQLYSKCCSCGSSLKCEKTVKGSFLAVKALCECGEFFSWNSQPLSGTLPLGNLLTAAAILFAGCHPSQVLTMFQHASVQMICQRTYNNLQTLYLVPTISSVYQIKQLNLFEEIKETGVALRLGGDARCCSPGHTAKYGSYSLMDLTKTKILDIQLVQDEINEIPFFEIKLAREIAIKIFQYLDIRDLCSCAQVSRSWRSLAEDELLWCSMCHKNGYEESFHTVDRANWKMIVRNHVETKRRLDLNWRNRIGKVTQLEHMQGGYLCAVTSDGETVVAGYTNGQVKMWDIEDQDQCIFNPSNTALIIDEGEESGTISNFITHIALSSTLVAAAYKHGNVDIWRRSEGTDPIQTIRVGLNNNNNRNNHVYKDNKDILLATHSEVMVTVSGQCLKVYQSNDEEQLSLRDEVILDKWIHSAKIYGDGISFDPMVTIATENAVKLYKSDHPSSQMIDIHSHLVNWGYVTCIDVKPDDSQLAVGLDMSDLVGDSGLLTHEYPIKIYDVSSNKLKSTLLGSTWIVTCMNTHDSPTNMVVTGSGDRKIRVYDIRTNNPVVTYAGLHSLTSVQMDEWKVVSSGDDGFVCVWDQRMATKLWDWHNSSPVKHCRFSERRLIVGNVPTVKSQVLDEFETHIPKRLRGTISVYDFTVDQLTEGVPEECLSTYDQPEAYNYNIRLAMPYDNI